MKFNPLLILTLLATHAFADAPPSYAAQAAEVTAYLQKTFYDPATGLYARSTTNRKPEYVWRQAAVFAALVGAARYDPQTYRPILAHFFHALDACWDTQTPIPAYEPAPTRGNGHDKYYDDNAWLVITFAEAYQLTGEQAYLDRATAVARFVNSGSDDKLGGGIWWHQSHKDDSKNTCANAPAAVGYLALARLGPPAESELWRSRGTKAVDWTCEHLQASDGLFEDRIIVTTGEVKKGKLTYNSALMLRACLELGTQTDDARYTKQAQRISTAADWFLASTGVYRDPLKWSQFMVEADIEFYRVTGDAHALARARTNADAYYTAWKKSPSTDLMTNAGIARMLWLLADLEAETGRAFWKVADQGKAAAK